MVAWRADGRELYYLGPDRGVMAVGVRTDSGFEFGKPRLLFKAPDSLPAAHLTNHQPDRTRLLCPDPQVATFKGTGDSNDAANFVCK